MLRYRKGPSPKNLSLLQASPGMVFDGLGAADRDPIRAALVRDQGALCAYCQRRIRSEPDPSTGLSPMKIEHWAAQTPGEAQPPASAGAAYALQWTNLLGVCHGGAPGVPGPPDDSSEQHCDVSRGNQPLFLHPVEGQGPDPRQHLSYTAGGNVRAKDPRAAEDLRVLNLNAAKLTRAREDVYSQLSSQLRRRGFTVGELRRLHARHVVTPGVAAPAYAEFVRYHLERKLRAKGEKV
jgi:uncharacterized protein (TIGR02646 family)